MTDQSAIVVSNGMMPALSIQDAVRRYNAVIEFTKTVMKPDKDYGTIPGTNKPTLLKPGAEKLCSLFALVPEFELADRILDFDKGLFYFQYRCKLYRDGALVGTGVGSCNSREVKYRYRNVAENKASAEDKASAIRTETKNGKYGTYKVYVIENREPFDLVNTLDKMAQKRALIAATLITTNASEFFTQDVEDMGFIEGEFSEVEPEPKKKAAPAPAQPAGNSTPPPPDEPEGEPKQPAFMTLEMALTETTSDGTPYSQLSEDDLRYRFNSLEKSLKNPSPKSTPEQIETAKRKRDAVKVILDDLTAEKAA